MTGAAIMIIEILGAKMLAPFVGTSHFVWTAQIAVTLVALAAGYYFGGRLVDQSMRLGRLYGAILMAAVYLALTIAAVEPVAYWCLKYRLAFGTLLASAFLFFVPLALLAMVGPFLVRVLTINLASVGGNIGRLTAVSTLGSFAGTVLIGYVLIPFLPNSVTMYLTAGVLMAVVMVYYFVWDRGPGGKVGAVTGMLAGLLFGYGGVSKEWAGRSNRVNELYRGNSNFGLLQVLESPESSRRFYLNDYLVQNTYDSKSRQSLALFTYMLHGLSRAYTPKIEDVLCIGLGVGIVPTQFAREGARVDVVEINPSVVPLAKDYFDCEVDKMNIVIGDGRYVVNKAEKKYDTIILDAFLGDSSPSHLMTREAFAGMQRILKPDGTLVINSFGEFDPGQDFLAASLDKTLKTVFASVRIHASGNGNVFFVASDRRDLQPVRAPNFDQVHPTVRQECDQAYNGIKETDPAHGILLRDDFNPAEFYDAANREEHRRRLALRMRGF